MVIATESSIMESKEILLGFSAREMWLVPGSAWVGDTLELHYWNETNKKQRLLYNDELRPLSTDYLVWPTVFDFDKNEQMGGPSHSGFIQDLWDNLDELLNSLQNYWTSESKCCWVIGVTLMWDLCSQEQKNVWSEVITTTLPPICNPTWKFLGYDVSDRWLLSGLTGCLNKNMPNWPSLKVQWGQHLNSYNLFDHPQNAENFKNQINQMIPQHAPFYVYGLWLVQEM